MNLAEKSKVKIFDETKRTEKSITRQGSTFSGRDASENPIFSSWLVRFVGNAFSKAEFLRKGDTIIINSGRVDNYYNKTAGKSSAVITVFDFDIAEN